MGVDVSVTVGLGVIIPAKDIESYLDSIGDEDGVWEYIEGLVGGTGLSYAACGNEWVSGVHSFLFGPPRLMTTLLDRDDSPVPLYLEGPEVLSVPELKEMGKIIAKVYGEDREIPTRAYVLQHIS